MISSIIQVISFFINTQPNMSEQEKKRQRIYNFLNAETKPNFLCLLSSTQRQTYRKINFLRKSRSGGFNKKN